MLMDVHANALMEVSSVLQKSALENVHGPTGQCGRPVICTFSILSICFHAEYKN